MNFKKLKAVLFDLDGTLLDTAPDLGFALNKLLESEGLSPVSIDKVRQVASEGSQGLLGLGFNITKTDSDYARYHHDFIELYRQNLSARTKLFPGMEEVLNSLDKMGFQWGVVTNKPTALTKQLLGDLSLADRCACIIGGCCVSQVKPHPEPLLLACERIHYNPKECVYVGDAPRDIAAAKEAGMRSIAALYGYLSCDCTPESWQADYYIDHPKDILNWLEKFSQGWIA